MNELLYELTALLSIVCTCTVCVLLIFAVMHFLSMSKDGLSLNLFHGNVYILHFNFMLTKLIHR